jgi:hypothetical protein
MCSAVAAGMNSWSPEMTSAGSPPRGRLRDVAQVIAGRSDLGRHLAANPNWRTNGLDANSTTLGGLLAPLKLFDLQGGTSTEMSAWEKCRARESAHCAMPCFSHR